MRWLRMAAEQGHVEAQFNLGGRYDNGAGANGYEPARELREDLEALMTQEDTSRATELARMCMASNYRECRP